MATSRRSRATGRTSARSSNRGRAPASEALEPNVSPDELDVEEPTEETDGSSRRSAVSARSASARNSRRLRGQSSAGMPAARKSKRVLTPEEQKARKKAIKNFLVLVLCLSLFLGAVGAGWYFLIKEDPRELAARDLLSQGRIELQRISSSIGQRQPSNAREAYNKALKTLRVPLLSNAKEPIDEHDKEIASVALARKAVELVAEIKETEPRIDKLERDIKAEANHRIVMEGFSKLSEISEADLVELEKNAGLFLKNPVEPPAGDNDAYVSDYQTLIQEVQAQMFKIEQEKERRLASVTSDQEKQAHGDVKVLVKSEQFKDALDKLDEYESKYPTANFSTLRTFVTESAAKAWEGAEHYASSRYKDYKAPGIPKPIAEQALKDARTRLEQVVNRFGIDQYVSKANALLNEYPQPE